MNKSRLRETSILLTIAIISVGVIVATVVGKIGSSNTKIVSEVALTDTVSDASMKQDLLRAKAVIGLAVSNWNNTPPADIPITFDKTTSTWSVIYREKSFASGSTSVGNTLSGTIWTNGSYCVQATNPTGTNTWILDSINTQVLTGTCGKIPF